MSYTSRTRKKTAYTYTISNLQENNNVYDTELWTLYVLLSLTAQNEMIWYLESDMCVYVDELKKFDDTVAVNKQRMCAFVYSVVCECAGRRPITNVFK